jgi:hypothetical protein
MKKEFINPYQHCEKEVTGVRYGGLQILEQHHRFFWSLRASRGTLTTVIGILLAKLYDELHKRGIVDISCQKEFEEFVANCELTLKSDEPKPATATKSTKSKPTGKRLNRAA